MPRVPILRVLRPKNTDRINLPKLAAFTGSCFVSALQKKSKECYYGFSWNWKQKIVLFWLEMRVRVDALAEETESKRALANEFCQQMFSVSNSEFVKWRKIFVLMMKKVVFTKFYVKTCEIGLPMSLVMVVQSWTR